MEGIITWNIFLVGFLTELCLYIAKPFPCHSLQCYHCLLNLPCFQVFVWFLIMEHRQLLLFESDKFSDKIFGAKTFFRFAVESTARLVASLRRLCNLYSHHLINLSQTKLP